MKKFILLAAIGLMFATANAEPPKEKLSQNHEFKLTDSVCGKVISFDYTIVSYHNDEAIAFVNPLPNAVYKVENQKMANTIFTKSILHLDPGLIKNYSSLNSQFQNVHRSIQFISFNRYPIYGSHYNYNFCKQKNSILSDIALNSQKKLNRRC